MASLPPRSAHILDAPEQHAPPTPRRLRAQSVYRLQVGLFGLCAMLLIVGLANIIMDRARLADAANLANAATAQPSAKPASDPLADIGVVPAADPSASASGLNGGR